MKRALAVLPACLALAACGSHSASSQQKQEAQREVAKFEQVANKCLPKKNGVPNLLALRSKATRQQFTACVVPPAQRVAFERCATHAVIGHFSKAKIEAGLSACLQKVS